MALQVVSDPDLSNSEEQTTAAHSQPSTASAKTNSSCSANSYTMGLFGRWIKPLPVKPTSSGTAASCRTAKAAAAAGAGSVNPLPDLSGPTAPESVAASTYEVVEQQPPLHLDLPQQEAFVMVSFNPQLSIGFCPLFLIFLHLAVHSVLTSDVNKISDLWKYRCWFGLPSAPSMP